jgi:hypothetical protein
MKTRARLHRWAVMLAAIAMSASALAQPAQKVPPEAEKLYAQAAAAMIKKDYATACPKFEEVTRMVPDGGGVRLNLAECYEEQGKLASALGQYDVAETLAKKDNRKDRLQAATKGIARVKPKVAMLIVEVPQAVRSAPEPVIKLDGEVLNEKQWGVPYPVDKGAHTLVASAKGYEPATVPVDIAKDGTSTTASIPSLTLLPPPPVAPTTPPALEPSVPKDDGAFSPQVRTAVLIGGGTLALGGLVAGGISLGLASAKGDEKKKALGDPEGRDAANAAARAEASVLNVAIWCFVGGGATALGTGAFYFLTRPRAKPPVSGAVFVGPSGPSIWIEGQF